MMQRRNRKVDRRRKSRVSRNAPTENTIVDESEVGSTGRAGRLIGGASHRSAGRQRRRDAIAGKLEADPHARQDSELDAQAEGQLER